MKPKLVPDENWRSVEEIIIPFEKEKKYVKIKHHKRPTLLNNSTVSKFVTINWNEVNYLSGDQYSVNKNINFETPMIRSDLCDYSDLYIALKGRNCKYWYRTIICCT